MSPPPKPVPTWDAIGRDLAALNAGVQGLLRSQLQTHRLLRLTVGALVVLAGVKAF